jgi:hypothetical protein
MQGWIEKFGTLGRLITWRPFNPIFLFLLAKHRVWDPFRWHITFQIFLNAVASEFKFYL